MDDDLKPWDRQEGEPARWFARFDAFRALGPGRCVLNVYNAEREKDGKGAASSIPGAWQKASVAWRWKKRAEAWDAAERSRLRKEHGAAIAQARQQFRQIGVALRDRATAFLNALPANELPPLDLIRVIEGAQRLELGLAEESAVAELERQMNEIEGMLHGTD